MNRIVINPITRLEGHGKIAIFLDQEGEVANVYLQIPELRGFEKFCEGRPAEDMPQILQRICGVCPEAHHLASTKALDNLFKVEPTSTARKIRELLYSAFFVTDHATHFYILAGPDFIMGPESPPAERNILGVIGKLGVELGKKVIQTRQQIHWIIQTIGGRGIHPVFGLPGGVSKAVSDEDRAKIEEIATQAVDFARLSLKVFDDLVLKNKEYLDMVLSDTYTHRTYYMGLVDEKNRVNFYDGKVRIVDPQGKEFAKYAPGEYLEHLSERVEPWTYLKFPYLKKVGWNGFTDGEKSGIYRATPLSRLNVADGMATPLAHEEYEKMYATLGGKPVHHTLATHWARLIEMLYAAERMLELSRDPEITGPNIRNIPTEVPAEGVGIVEAPRGTLTHHYLTDEKGLMKECNLIVGTTNNYAAISMTVKKVAQGIIRKGTEITEGLLNRIELAWRAYDPCMGCATHTLPGQLPIEIAVYDADGTLIDVAKRS
jgi:F420-non-reducing hydrogenase large subunit